MEKVYIKKRNINIITVAYFCLLSLFYLFFIHIFKNEESLLISSQMEYFLREYSWYVALSILTLYSVWFFKKMSVVILFSYLTFPIFAGFFVLFFHFDKLLLFSIFFYVIFSYFIFFIFYREIKSSYFCSNYLENDFLAGNLFKLKIEITVNQKVYVGELTNWDSRSLFIHFADKINLPFGSDCNLVIPYLGRHFYLKARPLAVTKSKNGFGFEIKEDLKSDIKNTNANELGWNQIYHLLLQRGHLPA